MNGPLTVKSDVMDIV